MRGRIAFGKQKLQTKPHFSHACFTLILQMNTYSFFTKLLPNCLKATGAPSQAFSSAEEFLERLSKSSSRPNPSPLLAWLPKTPPPCSTFLTRWFTMKSADNHQWQLFQQKGRIQPCQDWDGLLPIFSLHHTQKGLRPHSGAWPRFYQRITWGNQQLQNLQLICCCNTSLQVLCHLLQTIGPTRWHYNWQSKSKMMHLGMAMTYGQGLWTKS